VLERDVRELSRLRQREQLPVLLRRLAAQTAGVLNITRAAGEAELDRATAADYLKLLEAVFLVMRLPAWGTTVRARATSAPKVHVVDAGVAARLLRLTPEKLARAMRHRYRSSATCWRRSSWASFSGRPLGWTGSWSRWPGTAVRSLEVRRRAGRHSIVWNSIL